MWTWSSEIWPVDNLTLCDLLFLQAYVIGMHYDEVYLSRRQYSTILEMLIMCAGHLCHSNVFPVLGFIHSFEHGKYSSHCVC